MNDHLIPVFERILPAIERAGIRYWVYGGVAIAGIKGRFIRDNEDADVFVLGEDYSAVLDTVETPARSLGWTIQDTNFKDRPKREFFRQGSRKDVLSLMPAYRVGDLVRVVFQTSKIDFPLSMLNQQKRTLGSYIFSTPDTDFIKELFIHNLRYLVRSKKFRDRADLRNKYEIDAAVILNESESDYFWGPYSNK